MTVILDVLLRVDSPRSQIVLSFCRTESSFRPCCTEAWTWWPTGYSQPFLVWQHRSLWRFRQRDQSGATGCRPSCERTKRLAGCLLFEYLVWRAWGYGSRPIPKRHWAVRRWHYPFQGQEVLCILLDFQSIKIIQTPFAVDENFNTKIYTSSSWLFWRCINTFVLKQGQDSHLE